MKYINYFKESVTDSLTIDKILAKFSNAEDFANAMISGLVTELSFNDFGVSISNLKIAETDLEQGRESVTPNAPIEVIFNVDTNDAFLIDGYHRYLKARGGSIENALKHAKSNKTNKILCVIKLEKNYKSKTGFTTSEELTKHDLIELFKTKL